MPEVDAHSRLEPSAHAPYPDPETYILDWTDRIWLRHGIGLIPEMYAADLVVHEADHDVHGAAEVVRRSIMTRASFPERSGIGEDVVWEPRGPAAFVSYHRILHTGTQDEVSAYGPPTTSNFVGDGIAVCLVRDAMVVEEWVVRDEYAMVQQLGFDPVSIARERAAAAGPSTSHDRSRFGPAPDDPLRRGESGARPATTSEEVAVVEDLFALANARHLHRLDDVVHRDVVIRTPRGRTAVREDGYRRELTRLLGPFPDARMELRDIAHHVGPAGPRVSALWRLVGTYSGIPLYGPVTGTPIEILGISSYEFQEGRIRREWRVHNDIAVHTQVQRARLARAEGAA